MNVNIFGNTNVGKVRTNNEDTFIAQPLWDDQHYLCVVIDGVGGHDGGEIAAEIARETIVNYLDKYPNGEMQSLLKQAVNEANNTIYKERLERPAFGSMSCVLTACLVDLPHLKVHMAHVGDTRLYKYYKAQLIKLSHDHSLVGYREEIGELTEEEAMNHPQRNIIGRDVGSELHKINDEDFIESVSFPLNPGSSLLLCSDGLCDMVTSAEMSAVLQKKISAERKAEELINKANEHGGKDNVTVIVVDFDTTYQQIHTESEVAHVAAIAEPVKVPDAHYTSTGNQNIDIDKSAKKSEDPHINKEQHPSKKYPYILSGLVFLVIGVVLGWFSNGQFSRDYKQQSKAENMKTRPDTTMNGLVINDTVSLNYDTIYLKNIARIKEIKTIWIQDKALVINNQHPTKSMTIIINADANRKQNIKFIGFGAQQIRSNW